MPSQSILTTHLQHPPYSFTYLCIFPTADEHFQQGLGDMADTPAQTHSETGSSASPVPLSAARQHPLHTGSRPQIRSHGAFHCIECLPGGFCLVSEEPPGCLAAFACLMPSLSGRRTPRLAVCVSTLIRFLYEARHGSTCPPAYTIFQHTSRAKVASSFRLIFHPLI